MKNISIILLFLSLCVLGCKKKPMVSPTGTISSLTFDGKLTQRVGTKLEISAINTTSRCNIPQYSINISQRSFNDTLIEDIVISDIPLKRVGVIPLYKGAVGCDTVADVSFTMTQYQSFVVAGYHPLKNFDNYVNVVSFDDKTKEVKGKFKLTLVNLTYDQYPKQFGYHDTIVFESGDFTVRLQ